jgi:glycosyltransferase involved in cell wall biosynthesis
VILGDGDEREALTHLMSFENIRNVSFPGFRQIDELPIYYGLASVFIHPAYQEQWGLVVNEAMAAGLPVLVSNRCGCAPDLVSDGNNGFTFSPEDVTALADLMMKVSSGQVNLQAMSLAARNRIGERGPKRFAQGLYGALQVALQ